MEMESINLETFTNGILQEHFKNSLNKVLKNMQDVNTPYKDKRKITIEFDFAQNEQRNDIAVSMAIKEKLAAQHKIDTKLCVEKDLATGKIIATEYGKQIKGQMNINDYSVKVVDVDTGEIIEDGDDVINFQRAAKN